MTGMEKSIYMFTRRMKGKYRYECPKIVEGRIPICVYLDILDNTYKNYLKCLERGYETSLNNRKFSKSL